MKKTIIILTVLSLISFSAFSMKKHGQLNNKMCNTDISKEIFEKLDLDKNGTLSLEEFQNARKNFNKNKKTQNFPKAIINKFDTNNNGIIDKDENIKLKDYFDNRMKQRHSENLKKYDSDKDGKLSRDEMKEHRMNMRETMKNKMEEFHKKYDINKNNRLEKEEIDNMTFEDIEKFGFPFMKREHKGMIKNNRNTSNKKTDVKKHNRKLKGKKEKALSRSKKQNILKEYYMMRFDKDKNNILDRDEKIKLQNENKKYFERFDIDKNGLLNNEERTNYNDFMKKIAREYLNTRNNI